MRLRVSAAPCEPVPPYPRGLQCEHNLAVDNLCHTLVGAACGEAGLKRRTGLGSATLMIAANLPDLDVLVFATDVPSVAFRRGWTHGVLAQALLPLALAGLMMGIGRARAGDGQRCDFRALLLLSYIGVLSHVALDVLNNYGVRLLMPFSGRWFYGDAVFILDPWLWLILGIGIWRAFNHDDVRAARGALIIATIYILAMVVSARLARGIVLDDWRARHGGPPRAFMVGPVGVTPFHKVVIVDAGDRYETGTFNWRSRRVTFRDEPVPKRDAHPLVERAKTTSHFQAVLIWARFPYYRLVPAPDGTTVILRDLRFEDRVGGVATTIKTE